MARAVVVTGPEATLVDREVRSALAVMSKANSDLDVITIDFGSGATGDASGMTPGEKLAQTLGPSLFGDAPIVVCRAVESADDSALDALKAALLDPEGPLLLIAHGGGARGRGVVNTAAKVGATVIKCAKPNERDVRSLMRQAAAEAGGRLEPDAEQWLVDAIGTDALAVLLAAVVQAVTDSPSGTVDAESVQLSFPARAKVSAFRVADHVWAGRSVPAVRLVRGMEQRDGRKGVGVSVVAALAHGLRMMALIGQPGSVPPADFPVQPWQADRARENVRRHGWSARRIAMVTARLPELDAEMKGGVDKGVALDDEQKMTRLERVVLRLSSSGSR